MRFSLRSLLILTAVVAAAIGLAFKYREYENGVEVPVPGAVEFDSELHDYEVPTVLLEIRSWRQVRDHKNRYGDRARADIERDLRQLEQFFDWFGTDVWWCRRLIEKRPADVERIARDNFKPTAEFEKFVNATWILDHFGDQKAYGKLVERVLDQRPEDQETLYELFFKFEPEKLAADPHLVGLLRKAAVKNPNWQDSVDEILFFGDIDHDPLFNYHAELGAGERESIDWLAENRTRLLELFPERYPATVAAIAKSIQKRIEPSRGRRYDDAGFESIDTLQDYWRLLAKVPHTANDEFWDDVEPLVTEDPIWVRCERVAIIARSLVAKGKPGRARKLLADQLERTRSEEDPFDSRKVLFETCRNCLSLEAATEICLQFSAHGETHAVEQLGQLYEGSNNKQIATKILDATGQLVDGQTKWPQEILTKVDRIYPLTDQQRSQATTYSSFSGKWLRNGITRRQFIEWINEELQPRADLTYEAVLENKKYPIDHWVWHAVTPDVEWGKIPIDSDEKFAALALAHSARGCLVFDDRYPLEALVDVMILEIGAIESKEFRAASCVTTKEGRTYKNSFVINDRLYKFDHREGPHGSDDRYSAQPAIQILNTICARQNLAGRFRTYSTPWDITLTLYLTSAQETELATRFGMTQW